MNEIADLDIAHIARRDGDLGDQRGVHGHQGHQRLAAVEHGALGPFGDVADDPVFRGGQDDQIVHAGRFGGAFLDLRQFRTGLGQIFQKLAIPIVDISLTLRPKGLQPMLQFHQPIDRIRQIPFGPHARRLRFQILQLGPRPRFHQAVARIFHILGDGQLLDQQLPVGFGRFDAGQIAVDIFVERPDARIILGHLLMVQIGLQFFLLIGRGIGFVGGARQFGFDPVRQGLQRPLLRLQRRQIGHGEGRVQGCDHLPLLHHIAHLDLHVADNGLVQRLDGHGRGRGGQASRAGYDDIDLRHRCDQQHGQEQDEQKIERSHHETRRIFGQKLFDLALERHGVGQNGGGRRRHHQPIADRGQACAHRLQTHRQRVNLFLDDAGRVA